MSWNIEDLNGFNISTNQGLGQINLDSELGNLIYNIVKDNDFNIIYDIGCWNTLGTTKCIIEALKIKKNNKTKVFAFEINKDKVDIGRKLNNNIEYLDIIHGTLLNSYLTYDDILQYFPHIDTNETLKYWCKIDLENLKSSSLFTSHKNIDLTIFDGGEWTTIFEFLELKNYLNHIILDDINTDKCKLIVENLDNDKSFKCIIKNLVDRNGWAYYRKDI